MNGKASKNGIVEESSSVPDDYLEVLPDRGHWSGRFDFLLACLGTAVGLGNVWRFPYLCYKNGGGAFLIPYILMVFLVGMPVFLVELGLGQYGAMGPLKLFSSISPLFKGMGYAMIFAASMVAIYYNMIIGWTLFYFFDSFRANVQLQYCLQWWNTDRCFNDLSYKSCKAENESNVFLEKGFNTTSCYNSSYALQNNIIEIPQAERRSPSEEYFNNYMLNKSDGIDDFGTIQWQLAVSLLVAWLVVVLSLIKGIKTSGKVVYFTATFPYVILIILFMRGVTLEGAAEGIYYYVVPDFSKLYEVQVWRDAAIQVFYSFSIGGGGMITYASYNRFHNNLIKDVLIIGIGDMLTSLFSGLVVFSMLGFMAVQLQKPVADVVESGTALAFIAYPDAIARMPISTLWALLFFFMLFLLGIDSQFAMVETIITFIFDRFPGTRARKPLVVICVGVVLFILGLPLTTNAGVYLLEILDNYAAGWPYLVIGLLELIMVAYVYGMSQFMADLKEMTGWTPRPWIKSHLMVTVMTISPLVIGMILLLNIIYFQPLELRDYVFPTWGNILGFILAGIPIACIPVVAIMQICMKHKDKKFLKRLSLLLQPTEQWRTNALSNSTEAPRALPRSIGNGTTANLQTYENSAMDEPPPLYTLSHL